MDFAGAKIVLLIGDRLLTGLRTPGLSRISAIVSGPGWPPWKTQTIDAPPVHIGLRRAPSRSILRGNDRHDVISRRVPWRRKTS